MIKILMSELSDVQANLLFAKRDLIRQELKVKSLELEEKLLKERIENSRKLLNKKVDK